VNTTNQNWKKNLILCAILLSGFALRIYNLDFPSIGYHNMKENESLSIAQEMKNSNDFIKKKVYFYNAFEDSSAIKKDSELALVPYQILLSWQLFGENLWGGRLFNIIFALLSILLMYFICLLLFANANLALFGAAILAMLPLSVFFSRNLQAESPAFFFMLLGNLLYLRFALSLKKYNLFLGGLSFFLAWAYKPNFLFGLLPPLFCFPFKVILRNKKQILKHSLAFLAPYLLIVFTIFWLRHLGEWQFSLQLTFVKTAKLFQFFSPSYWSHYAKSILWFTVAENYTVIFSILSLLGILLAFMKGGGLLNRYIIGWTLTVVPFGMLFSEQIYQQGFSQMPFLGLVSVSSVYIISFISQTLSRFIRRGTPIFLMCATVAISLPFVYGAIYRMYATVFLGADVAGETLKELTLPDERVFLFTHAQGYAIARYAQRYVGWPSNFKDFQEKENRFKIRYICVYPLQYLASLESESPELFNYIQGNYHLKELGMLEEPNRLIYAILEKGKGQNLRDALGNISGQIRPRAIYKLFGRYIFFYTVRMGG